LLDFPPGGRFIFKEENGEGDVCVKINEVEALSGIPKKNIRFYEEQGLLAPRRNSENGYREYGDADVQTLRRIRLLRKLGVPIGEIRKMLDGTHTVGDGMRRHLIALERKQQNLEQSVQLCRELQAQDGPLSSLDAEEMLRRMEALEQGGTVFYERKPRGRGLRYTAAVLAAAGAFAVFAALIVLLLWAYRAEPENAPPLWVVLALAGVFAAMAAGVLLAFVQRIRELRSGEEEQAEIY